MDKIIIEPKYNEVIDYIKNNTKLKVEDLDFQMKTIFNKSISLSNKSEDDLIHILKNQTEKLKAYISVFYNFDIDNSQEYDEFEEPDKEEEDELLVDNSTSYGVVINFLIVLSYLIDNDINGFDEYLKKKKTPKRKKYIQEIQTIYNQIN